MENSIVDQLSKLIRINSVNLTLSHGPGENEIATFIRRRLDELEQRLQSPAPALESHFAVEEPLSCEDSELEALAVGQDLGVGCSPSQALEQRCGQYHVAYPVGQADVDLL